MRGRAARRKDFTTYRDFRLEKTGFREMIAPHEDRTDPASSKEQTVCQEWASEVAQR